MMKQSWIKYIGAALLTVSLVGCTVVIPTVEAPAGTAAPVATEVPAATETPSEATDNPDLQTAETIALHFQAWLDNNITDYTYTIERSCFCVEEARGPVTVEVRGDQITITDVTTGAEGNEFFEDVDTITKIYEILEAAAAEGADEITVTYDEATSVPLAIKVDKSFQMADEELYYTISNFAVLE